MKVMQVIETPKGLALQASERPVPKPGQGELLLRVRAAGVTPTEMKWQPTTRKQDGSPRKHAIPAHEFSGDVVARGDEVEGFAVGQAIYGMNDWYQEGALAEFCLAPATSVANKPKTLSYEQSATVPIGSLTAWQALTTHGHLKAGERVLVHGGAGGVGLFAVQFAKALGAHVIATAPAAATPLVKKLGADEVIDYHTSKFDKELRNIDFVLDTVGGETLERSWNVLGPRGRLVTVASGIPANAPQRTKDAFFIVEPDGHRLAEIAELLDSGKLLTFVKNAAPLKDAELAYTNSLPPGLGYGKTVICLTAKKI
ncbi:MAG TPA: NADP-dependent oxidoreductase [Edaphobacter sp.]|nr:NADP-dependent oxidoreductase [Edaphobacter sp.]